jgi:hypothetical protein
MTFPFGVHPALSAVKLDGISLEALIQVGVQEPCFQLCHIPNHLIHVISPSDSDVTLQHQSTRKIVEGEL